MTSKKIIPNVSRQQILDLLHSNKYESLKDFETETLEILILMGKIQADLLLTLRGNESAARRARVGSIKLAKEAQKFRKKSISKTKEFRRRRKRRHTLTNLVEHMGGSR